MEPLRFELNGREVEVSPRAGESLLEVLRDRLGVTSVKDGCSPQGQCGCCLALVDARPRVTCALPAERVAGKRVETLEGADPAELERLTDAFVSAAGLQCGFCIPGIALRTLHFVGANPEPSREEIARALDVHLCRCTGYVKIIDAVETYAAARRGEGEPPEPCADGRVGRSLARYQGAELTLGRRPYVADLAPDGLLHGAVRLSDHPRARVVRIDTRRAESLPGVARVATASDVPGQRWYGLLCDDWPGLVAEGEEVRCVGDFLAAVAAVDEHTAREAAALVEVTYEVLEPVCDPEAALAEDAVRVNPAHPNRLSHTTVRRGDASAALADSAHVVEGVWETQRIEHLFLEPESALAVPREDGGLHLYSQGQGVFDDRRQVAAFLDLDQERVSIELVPNGGAFGGKEDMAVQPHAALLCRLTGEPVRLTLDREQSVRVHPKRHPIRMHYRVGCDERGLLSAVWARMVGDTGAYASVGAKVLERAAGHGCGPYSVANVDIEAVAACTNNPPCGAMRGFGANQAHFAMEGCVDLLAREVGLDGWEMRWRNAVEVGSTFSTGQVFEKSVGLKQTLEAVREAYDTARAAGKAVGIACGIKNSGIGNGASEWGKARLVIEEDDTISLYNGYTEMGQGLSTVLTQCAVEVTGLSASIFRPKVDSTFALDCGQTTGSRATLFGGRAVASAARKLAAALAGGAELADLRGEVFAADVVVDDTTAPGASDGPIKTHTSFGFATQVCVLDDEGRVEAFVAAHDVGRAINPALCEGQIEGSVHMGLGFALTEELRCVGGRPETVKLREIGVLRARDMPPVEVILIEDPEPEGPFGAKGVGEIGLVPTAAAVAGALAAHDGVQRRRLPMGDSPAAQAMSVGLARRRGRQTPDAS
ncbi:MAG: selenium-dependent xanthine dehydrogenase [Planctomycetes bacterium]|jgi:xanthine dehydrogenase molybdenum-binding subunit|nr:selenium-dependent xanthine dehydrogenase [Planctomycetota bacterium]MDP6407760.1 selenium-dependent xanthine dehydrogenase [Planctomycetota bacterium]